MNRSGARLGASLPVVAMAGLILWSWQRLRFFDSSVSVATADGAVSWPNALASVDHPFHAARFGIFLDALRDGYLPHWVFSHQGGYPAEFYPFGSSLVDLFVWIVTLGQLSMPMVHTWAVAIVFALPAFGFLGIARLADLPLWLAPIGLASHLCVRGWWWSGGSYELIEWGLITNVLAAVLMFLAMVAVASGMNRGSRRWLVLAGGLISWGIYSNPRSSIAVVTIGLAAIIVWRFGHVGPRTSWSWLIVPFAFGVAGAAPLLMSLIRYNDLYFFVHYSGYANLREWFDSSIQAVSGPVFMFAVVGLLLSLVVPRSPGEQLIAWTALIYCALTVYLVLVDWPTRWTEQLETTRLMPFQRLLMVALAAIAVGRISLLFAERWSNVLCAGTAALIPVLYVIAPPSAIPESDRGLVRVGTMAEPGIVDLHAAVTIADESAAPGTAILILGTTAYWHDALWAPLWSDRLLFYDDWLWYWQRQHAGDYDPSLEHAYPADSSTITREYLETHGIGAVVVTGEAKDAAASAFFLEPARAGVYDVYLVANRTTLATLDSRNVPSTIDGEAITVSDVRAGGTLLVRENWFARWRAEADGQSIPIVHRSDGYMELSVPPGSERVTLNYQRTALDWLALLIAAGTAATGLVLLVRAKSTAPSEPQ